MPDMLHSISISIDTARARTRKSFPTTDGIRSAVAVTATLVLAAAFWVIALRQMSRMDMGTSTQLGSCGFFLAVWVPMMAAMMLPSAAPAVARRARSNSGLGGVPLFVSTYLAVWTAVGIAVYVAYRPHGSVAAGALVIAAGLYELTPFKSRCRQRCRQTTRSGEFTLACLGSSIALMLALVAIGIMSVAWMAIIAVLVLAQKILPPRRDIDISVALAIVALGVLILVAPTTIPGLMPSGLIPSM
jgi:predicted metal-binding membrane protein